MCTGRVLFQFDGVDSHDPHVQTVYGPVDVGHNFCVTLSRSTYLKNAARYTCYCALLSVHATMETSVRWDGELVEREDNGKNGYAILLALYSGMLIV